MFKIGLDTGSIGSLIAIWSCVITGASRLAAGHTYAHGAMSEPEMPTNIPTSIEEPEMSSETVMEENRDDDDDAELGRMI